MMGIDAVAALLVMLALSLMTVCPLHLAIARHKPRSLPISATLHHLYDYQPAAPDLERLADAADEALARDPLISATARLAETYRNT